MKGIVLSVWANGTGPSFTNTRSCYIGCPFDVTLNLYHHECVGQEWVTSQRSQETFGVTVN